MDTYVKIAAARRCIWGDAMRRLSILALAFTAALPAPAFAQDSQDVQEPSDSVNLVIVYGEDECQPTPDASVINVCVRMSEDERYRIPPNLRESSSPANESWANRIQALETVGASGINSCSPSGYGGWSGCTQKLIDQAYAEKRNNPNVRAAQLIAEERAKRLATIDAEAAAEQARVEELEKAYDEKKRAEAEAAEAAAAAQDGGQ